MKSILQSRKRRRVYFEKITPYVSGRLRKFKYDNNFEQRDIASVTGLTHTRITEIMHPENYGYLVLNESKLGALIYGGIVTVDEILKHCDLGADEKRATVEVFGLLDNKKMKELYQEGLRSGLTAKEMTEGFKKVVQSLKTKKK